MKQIAILSTAAAFSLLSTTVSLAQTYADNFHKSPSVNIEKVSFPNQYRMKVTESLLLQKIE